jgi:hypothetical protein
MAIRESDRGLNVRLDKKLAHKKRVIIKLFNPKPYYCP